jgi:hypothetical protein
MSTPEVKAKAKLKARLKKLEAAYGAFYVQGQAGSDFGAAGLDYTLCVRGRFVAIEVKRFDGQGRLTPRQRMTIEEIERAGGIALIVDSEGMLELAIAMIEGLLKGDH